eukprot:1156184-Pelagomonas_calceolata.AAC.21
MATGTMTPWDTMTPCVLPHDEIQQCISGTYCTALFLTVWTMWIYSELTPYKACDRHGGLHDALQRTSTHSNFAII